MILILDNYDSFTYNLVHSIYNDDDIRVIRNDQIKPEDAELLKPDILIISPGPGRPETAGFAEDYVRYFSKKIPILGICLGHQVICQAYGAKVVQAKKIVHGKQDQISIEKDDSIFKSLPPVIKVGRYHSLAVDEETLPSSLEVIARTSDGEIMGVKDKNEPVWGLQFHPESILTPDGKKIIENFLEEIND